MASITNTLARLERTRRAHPGPDITIAITTLEAVQDRFRRVPKS
jgi:hypothetical protein